MERRLCVFPGSFDPVTKGHLDLIERGAAIFDEVIVAVLHNPSKTGRFPVEKRLELMQKACAHLPNVRFDSFEGLLADYVRKCGAKAVLRGIRGVKDLESETQMAQLNRELNPECETLFLATAPQFAHVSSSAVREIALFGGDITPFVPECIASEVARILDPNCEC